MPSDGAQPSFDQTNFLERVGHDRSLAVELIGLFLRDLPTMQEKLAAALAAQDALAVKERAHALKGAVANFSADAVVRLAQRLEFAGRDQQLLEVEPVWVELQGALQRLGSDLQRFAAQPS